PLYSFFFLLSPPPPSSTLSPYTTLFRSERAAFAVAPTSIYGLAARYDLGERGTVNVTGLFQREQSAFTRPPLGFEPSSSFIGGRSEEHTSELQSLAYLVCRLLLEKKKNK